MLEKASFLILPDKSKVCRKDLCALSAHCLNKREYRVRMSVLALPKGTSFQIANNIYPKYFQKLETVLYFLCILFEFPKYLLNYKRTHFPDLVYMKEMSEEVCLCLCESR